LLSGRETSRPSGRIERDFPYLVAATVAQESVATPTLPGGRTCASGGSDVAKFMDVHEGMVGVTPEALAEAHAGDLAIQADEGVTFEHAWADPVSGKVFCLSEAPSAEAIQRIHTRNGIPPAEIHELKIEV
jgi:hypothetical protein